MSPLTTKINIFRGRIQNQLTIIEDHVEAGWKETNHLSKYPPPEDITFTSMHSGLTVSWTATGRINIFLATPDGKMIPATFESLGVEGKVGAVWLLEKILEKHALTFSA